MPFRIQRAPRGLSDLLSIFGGLTPQELAEQVHGTLDLLQFYALMQPAVVSAADPVLAENGTVSIVSPANQWWVLFGMHTLITKTATMTALRASLQCGPSNIVSVVAAQELGPFGATETGNCRFGFVPPFPRVFPPSSTFRVQLEILGTDATANVSVNVQAGVLG